MVVFCFKFVVVLLLVVWKHTSKEAQCVYLRLHLGRKSDPIWLLKLSQMTPEALGWCDQSGKAKGANRVWATSLSESASHGCLMSVLSEPSKRCLGEASAPEVCLCSQPLVFL